MGRHGLRSRALASALAIATATAISTRGAMAADVRAECVAAYEHAQRSRLDGKLTAARDELRVCARASCPALVARDCSTWLREVEQTLPTIVLSARTSTGVDVVDVAVSIDGKQRLERLDGLPFAVDPGEHELRFERAGAPPVVERVVVAASEKNRLVRVTLSDGAVAGGAATAPDGATRPSAPPSPAPTVDGSPPPGGGPLPWIVGAAGAAVIVAGIVVDVTGSRDLRNLRDTCAPTCSHDELRSVKTKVFVGDALIVGGAAIIAVELVVWLATRNGRGAGTGRGTAAVVRF